MPQPPGENFAIFFAGVQRTAANPFHLKYGLLGEVVLAGTLAVVAISFVERAPACLDVRKARSSPVTLFTTDGREITMSSKGTSCRKYGPRSSVLSHPDTGVMARPGEILAGMGGVVAHKAAFVSAVVRVLSSDVAHAVMPRAAAGDVADETPGLK